MKSIVVVCCIALLLVSCAAPKFAGQPAHGNEPNYTYTGDPSFPLPIDESTLVASISDEPVYLAAVPEGKTAPAPALTLTREEKKELRKEAVKQIKAYTKAVKQGDKAMAAEMRQAMDSDLKMAAIFGAVGIVSFIIGGDVFHVIGAIAFIIGVVFFVKWLLRQ